ncbi:MAG TPA: D-glucuronyl C5-epimerase family protein [Candidatus Baltobacteraceae bacterium]
MNLTLERAVPPNRVRQLALSFPLSWRHRRPFQPPAQGSGLGAYYIRWWAGTGTFGEDWETKPRDCDGVLLTPGGDCYHPIGIAQYALHAHDRARAEGGEAIVRSFLAQARWLRDNQQRRGGVCGCYPFAFPWHKYGAAAGWISAMAQGEAISALLRAEAMQPGIGFIEAAVRAVEPFRRSISEGGVVWRDRDGTFLEEVAVSSGAHILNGCIFALWGLYDLQRVAPQAWIGTLFDEVRETLERWLPQYDLGWWSTYSLFRTRDGRPHLATLKYHAFHVSQLRVLASMTGSKTFLETADRWEGYIDRTSCRLRVLSLMARNIAGRALLRDDGVAGGSGRARA